MKPITEISGYIEYSGSQTFAFENKQKMRIMHGVTNSKCFLLGTFKTTYKHHYHYFNIIKQIEKDLLQ